MFYQVNNKAISYLIAITLFLYYVMPFKLPAFFASFHVFTLFAAFFSLLILARFNFYSTKEDGLFYLYVVLFLSTSMLAPSSPKLNAFFSWISSLVLFWTISHTALNIQYKWLNFLIGLILFLWAVFSIAEALIGELAFFPGWFGLPRPSIYSSGLTIYSNYAAIIMLPLLISTFVQIVFKRERFKVALWFLGVMGFYFMMSRAAWLGLFVALALILYRFRADRLKVATIGKLIVIMCLALIISTLLPSKLDYIESSHSPNSTDENVVLESSNNRVDYSSNTRIVTLGVAIKAFTEHPLVGLGLGHFPEYYSRNYIHFSQNLEIDPRKLMTPHNGYIQLVAENGFFTFTVLMTLIFHILKRSYSSSEPQTIALFVSVISVLIWLLFHDGLGERVLWILLGLLSSNHIRGKANS